MLSTADAKLVKRYYLLPKAAWDQKVPRTCS